MKKNILILHTDAHLWRWLGCAESADLQTPNLDRLAEEGHYFTNAQACSGVCVPSRASLMTGRYPIATGVVSNQQKLQPVEKTMGRYFTESGYRTAYFGKAHYGHARQDIREDGWQEYFGIQEYNAYLAGADITTGYPEKAIESRAKYWSIGPSNIPEEHYFEKVITDKAISYLETRSDEPFLSVVSWIAPHSPFTPPGKYAAMYDPQTLRLAPRSEAELKDKPEEFVRWVIQNQKYLDEQDLRHFLAAAYGLVSLVDEQVGRIRDCLARQGLLESTLIIFTSDHGDYGTSYGILGKSWSMIDPLIKIPLIVRHPALASPGKYDGLVENIDILPTMLDYAGIAIPSFIQGRSFLPALEGKCLPAKEACFAFNLYESTSRKLAQSTIRKGRWRLITDQNGLDQLYNVEADPWNWHNLALLPEHAALVQSLKSDLLKWQNDSLGQPFDQAMASYWEDETLFWDETKFTGQRIVRRNSESEQ